MIVRISCKNVLLNFSNKKRMIIILFYKIWLLYCSTELKRILYYVIL